MDLKDKIFFYLIFFTQFAFIHQQIGLPLNYIFALIYILSKRAGIPRKKLSIFLVFGSILILSFIFDFFDAKQSLLYVIESAIALLFLHLTSSNLVQLLKFVLKVNILVVLIKYVGYIFFDIDVFSVVTLWDATLSSSYFPKENLLFSNPNWLSYNYYLALLYFIYTKELSPKISLLILLPIILASSKTIVSLSLITILYYYGKNIYFSIKTVFSIVVGAIMLYNADILFTSLAGLQDEIISGASYVNREIIYLEILKDIKWYPKGDFSNEYLLYIQKISSEDTAPSTLYFMRYIGLFLFGIITVAMLFKKNKAVFKVYFLMLLIGLSFSFATNVTTLSASILILLAINGESTYIRSIPY